MANKNDPQSDAREIASLYAIYDCVVNGNDPVQDFMVSKKTTQAINPEISALQEEREYFSSLTGSISNNKRY